MAAGSVLSGKTAAVGTLAATRTHELRRPGRCGHCRAGPGPWCTVGRPHWPRLAVRSGSFHRRQADIRGGVSDSHCDGVERTLDCYALPARSKVVSCLAQAEQDAALGTRRRSPGGGYLHGLPDQPTHSISTREPDTRVEISLTR